MASAETLSILYGLPVDRVRLAERLHQQQLYTSSYPIEEIIYRGAFFTTLIKR